MTAPTDTAALRATAEAATPGPWKRDTMGGLNGDVRGEKGRWIALCWGLTKGDPNRHEYKVECNANAEFIAAANPTTIKALLDELDQLRAALKEAEEAGE